MLDKKSIPTVKHDVAQEILESHGMNLQDYMDMIGREYIKALRESIERKKNDPCWKGYAQLGTKKKNGKQVPNCVPVETKE